ncbi:MAG: enoyl-CoA hydratase [Desulfobacteraceae bacterium]|nr:enoyl-CoA hydratase [Desulfobacteraceae bacterium]
MTDIGSIPEIGVYCQEGVCRIEVRRPEKKNALTRQMYAAMAEAIEKADTDANIRAVFLHGAKDCFCAGNDLKEFQQAGEDPESGPDRNNPFMRVISRAKKPMVAAVTGAAIGVGTTLLLHFDLVYAGSGASFSMPFVNLGLCPEAGSSFLLPRLVGHKRASEMLLLGEAFSPETAREFGLVNAVFPDDEVIEKAFEQAKKLAKQPPASARLTKALLKRSVADQIAGTMAEEFEHFAQRLSSAECKEALAAFFERRDPDFSQFS